MDGIRHLFIAPEELITKLWIVPVSIMGVLFPAFAERLATDPPRAVTLFAKGAICTFAAVFPLALIAAAMAREGLTLWLRRAHRRSQHGGVAVAGGRRTD